MMRAPQMLLVMASRRAAFATTSISAGSMGRRLLHASRPASLLFKTPADVQQDKTRVVTSANGALESRRYLVRSDECGFSVQHEILKKGKPVQLEFRNHVYAVMITSGHGTLVQLDGYGGKGGENQVHKVSAGSFFALNASERIELEAESDELHAVSVMNPPLVGSEQRLANGVFPVVDQDGVEREAYDHTMSRRLFEAPESLKTGSSPMKNDPLF